MKIGDLAARTGLSVHTLRYYERIGLLPAASRDAAGQRRYDTGVLEWIGFLGRLKRTGMPIRDMLRYAALRQAGDASRAQRCALLCAHRDAVHTQLAELQDCLLFLDAKIAGYGPQPERTHDADAEHPAAPRDAAPTGR